MSTSVNVVINTAGDGRPQQLQPDFDPCGFRAGLSVGLRDSSVFKYGDVPTPLSLPAGSSSWASGVSKHSYSLTVLRDGWLRSAVNNIEPVLQISR